MGGSRQGWEETTALAGARASPAHPEKLQRSPTRTRGYRQSLRKGWLGTTRQEMDQQPGEGNKGTGQAGTSCGVGLIRVTMALVLSGAEGYRAVPHG